MNETSHQHFISKALGEPTSFIPNLPSFLMFPLHNQSRIVFLARSWDTCRICWKPQADGEVVWSPLPPSGKPAANIPPWPWNLGWLLGDLPSVASWGEIKDLETAQACQKLRWSCAWRLCSDVFLQAQPLYLFPEIVHGTSVLQRGWKAELFSVYSAPDYRQLYL